MVPVRAQSAPMYPSCWHARGRAMGVCDGGCGEDAAAVAAAAVGTCSSGGPWRHPSYVPCLLCGGWSEPPDSGQQWLCGDALLCAPSQRLRSAGHCSPASGIPVDTPGHLWRLSDRRHAQNLKVRTEKGKGKGIKEEKEGKECKEDESSHTKAERF